MDSEREKEHTSKMSWLENWHRCKFWKIEILSLTLPLPKYSMEGDRIIRWRFLDCCKFPCFQLCTTDPRICLASWSLRSQWFFLSSHIFSVYTPFPIRIRCQAVSQFCVSLEPELSRPRTSITSFFSELSFWFIEMFILFIYSLKFTCDSYISFSTIICVKVLTLRSIYPWLDSRLIMNS